MMDTDRRKLIDAGYIESIRKPKLFYKTFSNGVVFADMREQDIVSVWVQSKDNITPDWVAVRIAERELKNLRFRGFSSYLMIHPFQPYDNGYCKTCGKDFRDSGLYCSDGCERIAFYKRFIEGYNTDDCAACGRRIGHYGLQHHISYFPEEVVWVHPDCHHKIHRTALYPHLKPPEGDADVYYGRKLCREHRQEQSFFYAEACNYDPEHPTWNRSVFMVKYSL